MTKVNRIEGATKNTNHEKQYRGSRDKVQENDTGYLALNTISMLV